MPAATHSPITVAPAFYEKIWGSRRLSPWFADAEKRIGEVWFDLHSPSFPLLTKFVFTTDRLSVQVHPGDEYAARYEQSLGKTEMWYVLRAEPGAQVALGLRERISRERLRQASESGEIMDLLRWIDVKPGQCIFVPAGTIHAIGGGLAILEIQQRSDITYRLFDYGRPRELHLDKGVAVSDPAPYLPPPAPDGFLARCPYFATQEIRFETPERYQVANGREHLLIIADGSGCLNAHDVRPGQVWHIPAAAESFPIEPSGVIRAIRTYIP